MTTTIISIIDRRTGLPAEVTPQEMLELQWQAECLARKLVQLIQPAELPKVIQGDVLPCDDMPRRLAAIVRLAAEQLAEMQAVNND